MTPHSCDDLTQAEFKPRIDGVTQAHVVPRSGGITWIVCENAVGELQAPFTCRTQRGVDDVLKSLRKIRPGIQVLRSAA